MTDRQVTTRNDEGWECPDWRTRLAFMALLFGLFVWVFSDVLSSCFRRWMTEPQYSHGFVIPLMAAGLAWWRRGRRYPPRPVRSPEVLPCVLVLAMLCHLIAHDLYLEALDAFAFVLAFAGIVLAVLGAAIVSRIMPAIGFWPS